MAVTLSQLQKDNESQISSLSLPQLDSQVVLEEFWAQNLRLNPGPTADAPWLLVVRWKPVSLRSSSPAS